MILESRTSFPSHSEIFFDSHLSACKQIMKTLGALPYKIWSLLRHSTFGWFLLIMNLWKLERGGGHHTTSLFPGKERIQISPCFHLHIQGWESRGTSYILIWPHLTKWRSRAGSDNFTVRMTS